jgi:hypothetical protein
MQLKVLPQGPAKNGIPPTIVATAKNWQAEIELQPTSPRTTRMRVLTREGDVFEKNTASEILSRVSDSLEYGLGWMDRYAEA